MESPMKVGQAMCRFTKTLFINDLGMFSEGGFVRKRTLLFGCAKNSGPLEVLPAGRYCVKK